MKNKNFFLIFFCLLNQYVMSSFDGIAFSNGKENSDNKEEKKEECLLNAFHFNQKEQEECLKNFLKTPGNKKILNQLRLFVHPDKCENNPNADSLFQLFSNYSEWLNKIPVQVKGVFINHFFELLKTNTSSKQFTMQLDTLTTLAAMTANNDPLREIYEAQPINDLLINGPNIVKQKDFKELHAILTSKYSNFDEIFNNSILKEDMGRYAYLYDLLKEFQTFDRCTSNKNLQTKIECWFDWHGQYKKKLEDLRILDNKDYCFAKNMDDQKKVAAAVIFNFYSLDFNEALFCDKEQSVIIDRMIQNWSNRAETYNQMGYPDFKDYKQQYSDLYHHLKTTLGNEKSNVFDSRDQDSRKIALSIGNFLENDILDFIDTLFILDNKTQLFKEKISLACLFCLNNNINPLKIIPRENTDKKLWTENISSFDSFVKQYQAYHREYPLFFESDASQEVKAQVILRFIELKRRNSENSIAFQTILTDPLFENKIKVIDHYLFYNANKRSFSDYIKSIMKAADKYKPFIEPDNETLLSFAMTEDRIFQYMPKNTHPQFKNSLKEMIGELAKNDPNLNEVERIAFFKNKISFLKTLLDCYMIPFELENRTRHTQCIPQQMELSILQETVQDIKEHLIQENWFKDTQNPELLTIAQDWIKSTVKANLLNIEAQPFDKLKEHNLDNDAKNKKIKTHFTYFNHYLNFITQYYLIIPKTDILDSFDIWLAASQQDTKKIYLKNNTSLPFSEDHTSELPKNNMQLFSPVIDLLRANNPLFNTNFTETTDVETEIEKEAQDQLHRSWKFKIQSVVQAAIQVGLLHVFSQSLGSKIACAFMDLKELKNKRYYDQAFNHYGIDKITDPNKKMFIKDRLKNDYNQYSHAQRLQQAVLAAAPFFNNAQLQKYLPYF